MGTYYQVQCEARAWSPVGSDENHNERIETIGQLETIESVTFGIFKCIRIGDSIQHQTDGIIFKFWPCAFNFIIWKAKNKKKILKDSLQPISSGKVNFCAQIYIFVFCGVYLFVVIGTEPKASQRLDKGSNIEIHAIIFLILDRV